MILVVRVSRSYDSHPHSLLPIGPAGPKAVALGSLRRKKLKLFTHRLAPNLVLGQQPDRLLESERGRVDLRAYRRKKKKKS